MFTSVLYQLAVTTDNSIEDVIRMIGKAGVDEIADLQEQHADWSPSDYVAYYINKYAIHQGNVIHHTKVLTAAQVLNRLIKILTGKGMSYADAVLFVSKTKSVKDMEMGETLYFPMFYDAFEEEAGLVGAV